MESQLNAVIEKFKLIKVQVNEKEIIFISKFEEIHSIFFKFWRHKTDYFDICMAFKGLNLISRTDYTYGILLLDSFQLDSFEKIIKWLKETRTGLEIYNPYIKNYNINNSYIKKEKIKFMVDDYTFSELVEGKESQNIQPFIPVNVNLFCNLDPEGNIYGLKKIDEISFYTKNLRRNEVLFNVAKIAINDGSSNHSGSLNVFNSVFVIELGKIVKDL